MKMTKKSSNRPKQRAFALILGILLGAGFAMSGCGSMAGHGSEAKEPACAEELTGFWGNFDEIRLFRYYLESEVPDMDDVPDKDVEYGDATYEHVSTSGPVDIGFGPCWEAMYREKPAGK